jgi:hypothetical protein
MAAANVLNSDCNCRCSCVLFSDDFDRSDDTDLGSDWTEETGNSEIKTNQLRTNGDAIVRTELSPPNHGLDRIVKVKVTAESNGDIARIHLGDYSEGTSAVYTIAEIEFASGTDNATARIIYFDADAGTPETVLRECAITAEAGTEYDFWFGAQEHPSLDSPFDVCGLFWEQSLVIAFTHDENAVLSSNPRSVGLESQSTNYVDWNDFSIERANDDDDEIENCDPIVECPWPNVADLDATEIELELTGFVNKDCLQCGDINGTYTLSYSGYEPNSGSTICGLPALTKRCACWQFDNESAIGCSVQEMAVGIGTQNSGSFFPPLRFRIDATVFTTPPTSFAGGGKIYGAGFMGSGLPVELCDLNEWITIALSTGSTDCQSTGMQARVRLKP